MRELAVDADATGIVVGIAASTFNAPVTEGLIAGALEWLEAAGAEDVTVVRVGGAFELPALAKHLAEAGYGVVVALGAVIEGETDHYHHIANRTSEGLMRVMLDTGVPVAFGVLTTRDAESALARSAPGPHNKGREAAEAAVRLYRAREAIVRDRRTTEAAARSSARSRGF